MEEKKGRLGIPGCDLLLAALLMMLEVSPCGWSSALCPDSSIPYSRLHCFQESLGMLAVPGSHFVPVILESGFLPVIVATFDAG